MTELAEIRKDIADTKAKLADAEKTGRSEAYLISLQTTLAEQQKENNLLLAIRQASAGQVAPAPTGVLPFVFPRLRSTWLARIGIESEFEQLSLYVATAGIAAAVVSPLRKAYWLDKYVHETDPSIKKMYAGNASFTNAQLGAAEHYLEYLKKKPRKFVWIPVLFVVYQIYRGFAAGEVGTGKSGTGTK